MRCREISKRVGNAHAVGTQSWLLGAGPAGSVALAREAERLGFDSVWTAEAYGSDAVTPLTWVGARTTQTQTRHGILQMPARTPAMTAMTAATLDLLSDGRVLLGLGLSGPQVVEGWHGSRMASPSRARENMSRSCVVSWLAKLRLISTAKNMICPSAAARAWASRSS